MFREVAAVDDAHRPVVAIDHGHRVQALVLDEEAVDVVVGVLVQQRRRGFDPPLAAVLPAERCDSGAGAAAPVERGGAQAATGRSKA